MLRLAHYPIFAGIPTTRPAKLSIPIAGHCTKTDTLVGKCQALIPITHKPHSNFLIIFKLSGQVKPVVLTVVRTRIQININCLLNLKQNIFNSKQDGIQPIVLNMPNVCVCLNLLILLKTYVSSIFDNISSIITKILKTTIEKMCALNFRECANLLIKYHVCVYISISNEHAFFRCSLCWYACRSITISFSFVLII